MPRKPRVMQQQLSSVNSGVACQCQHSELHIYLTEQCVLLVCQSLANPLLAVFLDPQSLQFLM